MKRISKKKMTMTGNVALDVFIGLVFIFLLYSLLATVVMEIVATNLGLRARNLKLSIYRMLSNQSQKLDYLKKERIFWFWKNNAKSHRAKVSFSKTNISLAEALYDSPLIRKQASSSWFSKPSAISPDLFVRSLISILDEGTSDTANNIQNFLTSPSNRAQMGEETSELLNIFYRESQGDIDRFKERIKEWYLEQEQRSIGWYKKRIQIWLFLIGMGIAIGFNVNALYIANYLSQNNEARRQLVEMASTYQKENTNLQNTEGLKAKELEVLFNETRKQAAEASSILGLSHDLPVCIRVEKRNYAASDFEKNKASIYSYRQKPDGNYIVYTQPNELPFINVGKYILESNGKMCITESGQFIFDKRRYRLYYQIPGWILTAFALSLGAPFWFDLLNKLMQLRGSVSQKNPKALQPKSNNEPIEG